jgi:outer membrane protein TolC
LETIHTKLKTFYDRGLVGITEVLASQGALAEKQLETIDLRAEWAENSADLFELSGVFYAPKPHKKQERTDK